MSSSSPPESFEPQRIEQADFDSGYRVVRGLFRFVLGAALVALALTLTLRPEYWPYATVVAILALLAYVAVTTKLRLRLESAKEEIAARGDRPYEPGDFSDEDEDGWE